MRRRHTITREKPCSPQLEKSSRGNKDSSLLAQTVKNSPALQEIWVRFLGWEDPLEKEMATHSGILACITPRTKEPGRLQSIESQRVRHDLAQQ